MTAKALIVKMVNEDLTDYESRKRDLGLIKVIHQNYIVLLISRGIPGEAQQPFGVKSQWCWGLAITRHDLSIVQQLSESCILLRITAASLSSERPLLCKVGWTAAHTGWPPEPQIRERLFVLCGDQKRQKLQSRMVPEQSLWQAVGGR